MESRDSSALAVFLAGACLGAGLALLFVTTGGSELRDRLRAYAREYAEIARDELLKRGKEVLKATLEEGRQYLEGGDYRRTPARG
jgi:gas vesicle protein